MIKHGRPDALSALLRIDDDLDPVPIAMHPGRPDDARRDHAISLNGDSRARLDVKPTVDTQPVTCKQVWTNRSGSEYIYFNRSH